MRHFVVAVGIAIISFWYIFFFTQCVPFFFDDHEFNRDYVQTSLGETLSQLVKLNKGSIADGPRPVFGLLFKGAFAAFGFDYCGHRVVKSVIFSLLILVGFLLGKQLFKTNLRAVVVALVIMTSFPLYIHTFGYNGPHIIAELFKMLAITLFLKDARAKMTSLRNQVFIFFCVLFAVKSYAPAYSVAGALPLFILLYDVKKMFRYLALFGLVVLIQFPITMNFSAGGAGEFGAKVVNIKHVFMNDFVYNIITLSPSYSVLYYKPFTAILSFFGFWLLAVATIGSLNAQVCWRGKKFRKNKQSMQGVNQKEVILLTVVWMVTELPTYVFLPEHAIRYLTAFSIPFVFFAAMLVIKWISYLSKNCRRAGCLFAAVMILGVVLTNVSYVYAFRAGWGSAFIGFENGMDYFAEKYALGGGKNIGVLYYASSAATEYKFVNKSSENYEFAEGVTYIKSGNSADFAAKKVFEQAQKYDSFFVLKRTTSVSKTGYPPVALEGNPNLKKVAVIEGFDERTFFDRVNRLLMKVLKRCYAPNKIVMYQFK